MYSRAKAKTTPKEAPSWKQHAKYDPSGKGRKDYSGEPQLKSAAAMMLMTLLYPARLARVDLLKAIGFLAKCITRWDAACDARLHELMCYIKSTLKERMVGFVGDKPEDLSLHIFCDADFAGCPYTLRSTDGVHADIQGPNTRFPWVAASKGQSLTAQSTPEAELASSLNAGMKDRGEPALSIWQKILGTHKDQGWQVKINLHEDNTTAIHSVRTGKNPTMKTLERNFGVKVGYMHEQVC